MPTSQLSRVSAVCLIVIPLVVACGGSTAQSVAPPAQSPAASSPAATASMATSPDASDSATPTPTPSLITVPQPTAVVTAAPTPTAQATSGPDYTGDWVGHKLGGFLKWCGSVAHPYWANDMVSNSGDKGFLAYLIPAGSTDPVAAEVDVPFIVPEFTALAQGTGQFVPGNPPHFIIVNGEGTWDVTLKVGKFCSAT